MKKINLHFFGTSYTEGGGFEFDINESEFDYDSLYYKLNSFYKDVDELNKFNFSFPGRLLKLIDTEKFKVFNHAKSGFGNDRLIREFFKVIDDKEFDISKNIFLFEFSWLSRDDFFHNDLKDYVVCNSNYDEDDKFEFDDEITVSYDYSTNEQKKIYYRDGKIFGNFLKKTKNRLTDSAAMFEKIFTFLSFLEYLDIKYYLIESPIHFIHLQQKKDSKIYKKFLDLSKKEINFSKNKYENFTSYQFIYNNKLTITDETENFIENGHFGYLGNNLIAKFIYNRLVDDGIIEGYKKDISLKIKTIRELKSQKNKLI